MAPPPRVMAPPPSSCGAMHSWEWPLPSEEPQTLFLHQQEVRCGENWCRSIHVKYLLLARVWDGCRESFPRTADALHFPGLASSLAVLPLPRPRTYCVLGKWVSIFIPKCGSAPSLSSMWLLRLKRHGMCMPGTYVNRQRVLGSDPLS